MAAPGRPRSLDDAKRREIYALLTAGYSMPAAAEYVNCSRYTIRREQKRNPEFAKRVRRAAIVGQLDPLSAIRQAAKDDWRAAAWYLERTNPDRFAKRNPALIKPEDMLEQMNCLAEQMLAEVKDEDTRDRILRRMAVAAGLIKKAVADHCEFDNRARPVDLDAARNSKFPDIPTPQEVETLFNVGEFEETDE
jgi:hypothetical protein